MKLAEAQKRVITYATESLEKELAVGSVDFNSTAVREPCKHLRHNLIELGLHSVEEDNSGDIEQHIRTIAKKGREYLDGLNLDK